MKYHTGNGMMNRAVLIVNSSYAPLTVCSAKRAICLCYMGKADTLEEYPETVHSPSVNIPLPSVIRLRKYIKYQLSEVVLNRKNILARDKFSCQYCGKKGNLFTLDHIIPKERGGQNTWENLVTACFDCNSRKRNRTPEEASMPLIRIPIRPNPFQIFEHYIDSTRQGWRPYLFMEALN